MYHYGNESEFGDSRHATPQSFRRTKESEEAEQKFLEEKKEQERQQLLIEQQHHQTNNNNTEQENMSNQVFGSHPVYNYPSDKPEPLDGRDYYQNRPGPMYEHQQRQQIPYESPRQQPPYESPRHQPPYESQRQNNSYESPRQQQNAYESPRQQAPYGQTYRSGRPDLGFAGEQPSYVPYPQEPIRRRRDYEQPPDIGYDPYSKEQNVAKPHPGWILLLRFHKDGETEVRRALTMCAKHIDSDGGRILGLAPTSSVHIREGGDAWVQFGKMRYFGGGKWGVQESPEEERTNYSVLAIYYPSLSRAIQWFDRDSCFKHKDFPARYTTDCIALPLNSSVDTKYCKTLVMTEYPKISHPEYFRDKFSVPTEDMMRKRFAATPYVVKATSIPTDDPRQRVARHLRGSWIKRNSIITISLFASKQETNRYFLDPEYNQCKEAQDRVSAPTTVVMDMENWRL